MNTLEKMEKKIIKMMREKYKPSLADSIRIYNEYKVNKGELADILSEIYAWLAQEPMCIDYKHGKLYMRCEMTNSAELFVIHYIYVNTEKDIALENFLFRGDNDITDSSIESLVSLVKEMLCDEISNLYE